MALDGVFLHSIVEELKNTIVGCRIDKVNQSEKDEIILTYNKNRKNNKLLITASANCARIHHTNIQKENPITPPMFCMVLRKYLNSARCLSIEQIQSDRVIIMDFESTDELGFDSVYSLVIEIMGRHSNISLIRKRDNIVMDSIKHVTGYMSSYRSLYPGAKFVFPPESTKLNTFDFSYEELKSFIENNSIESKDSMFSSIFTGVSKNLSRELYFRFSKNIENLQELYNNLKAFFENLKEDNFSFNLYTENNILKDFYCVYIESLENLNCENFATASLLVERFYSRKDKQDRLHGKTLDLQRLVKNNIDRCKKKISLLEDTLKTCTEKDIYQLKGELLTANIYSIEKGTKEVSLLNYYKEEPEYLTIELDENKTPSENVQSYYKKYNKLKKSEEMANIQLENAFLELKYLDSVMTNIQNAETNLEISDIRKELMEEGYIKFKPGKQKKEKKSKPLHFTSKDGLDIYVGKNNIQNDYLTLKFANKKDIWLHTKDIPGSHVIICNPGHVPNDTLEEAANLAAYFSKAKNSTKVAVDYTTVKNVKKPKGAKAGMVIYSTNQTIYIDPKEPNKA